LWWLYIKPVINMDFINGCINVISRVCRVYLIYLMIGSPVRRYCLPVGPVCTESDSVSSCVTCFVMLARAYSGFGSLVFCSSINKFCCCSTCMKNDSHQFINFPLPHVSNSCMVCSGRPYSCLLLKKWDRVVCFYISCMFTVPYFYWSTSLANTYFCYMFGIVIYIYSTGFYFVLWWSIA